MAKLMTTVVTSQDFQSKTLFFIIIFNLVLHDIYVGHSKLTTTWTEFVIF